MLNVKFELAYEGAQADNHELDFYDAASALAGFQRSLALTTHLILNGEIITQAPSLKGAVIMIAPPHAGSWKIVAAISSLILTGAYHVTTAPRDTTLGHLVASAYDYVIKKSLGFHVDFDSTLGQQYEEIQREIKTNLKPTTVNQLDSLTEKCELSVKEMHRPIYASMSATKADVLIEKNGSYKKIIKLDKDTYEYISVNNTSSKKYKLKGRVSSYNINTYTGRIFLVDEKRPISFELVSDQRTPRAILTITNSLNENARDRFSEKGEIEIEVFKITSVNGRLKKILIVGIG